MSLKQPPKPSYEDLEAELHTLRVERAQYLADTRRITTWLDASTTRKPAVLAFTEGPERQIAYRFEMLLRGEFICRRCGLRKNGEAPLADF
ncbi:MAG: hypothetical protein FD131_3517 [Rhodocyclaceae bacterium]|nr:MAG: hypothetical protein FD131_3517 [Rhodocyclaceae bacterium]